MSKNIRTQIGKVIGKTLNSYHARVKPVIDDIKFKEQYQGRIIDCMVGEVDDNYIETPETDAPIVKLEHSKEGLVKVPSIKGKTILVDSDGNETDTPAEGCRLVSVGEDEDNKLIILSKNKNLFDKQNWINQPQHSTISYSDNGIRLVSNVDNPYWASFLIYEFKLQANTSYKLTGVIKKNDNYNDATVAIEAYNSNGYLTRISTKQNNDYSFEKILTTSNDGYLKIQFHPCHGSVSQRRYDVEFKTIQLEKNDGVTSYEPHKSHKTEILLDKSLKKLPNGVCDEVVGNKLIRRIGKLVLNGTESWKYSPPSSHAPAHPTGEGFFMIKNGEFIDNVKSDSNLNNGFCNIFSINKNFYDANFYSNLQGIGWQNYFGNKYIFIRATKRFPSNSVEEFKNYLKDNNVVLYYELKEPIIEELPNGITLQGFDDTTMYIENSITPTVSYGYNALIPYKEELSKQKEEVETNTLDIENNIIPYLMDMEYNLMLMEDN